MNTNVYITKTADMYRFGIPAKATLTEYPEVSRTWTRQVTVELPEGFEAAETIDGQRMIFRGNEAYHLATDSRENPVIIDHTQAGGPYIPLPIIAEGWER